MEDIQRLLTSSKNAAEMMKNPFVLLERLIFQQSSGGNFLRHVHTWGKCAQITPPLHAYLTF